MRIFGRWLMLVVIAGLALQLFFVLRVISMRWIDPQSTAFERSEMWQLAAQSDKAFVWKQEWLPYSQISDNIKRAVIASEDGDFSYHDGVEWDAIEKAWQRNTKAEQQAERRSKRTGKVIAPKIVGGSTITQQLAKNLFLSGERTFLRKGQEFVITFALEAFVPKQRILEIYLNSVELGTGVFGVEAASQHYYRKSASRLSAYEAARLAVMLPRPKFFERVPNSGYLSSRAQTIVARMGDAELP
ncbi:monofunctional biosynthetic peptidoglycan transglycosylase [Variovorax sp. PCZ-1]|uniref:monofunctional biosynthetic peptidoglycan transglycosylase n=1 Tax=Variovorax sp. PCZ-1 TaxID=2835533 RepID=UPI001BCE9372|nr:monofunctional biosynthetic peptidoglycan transglycosylase [Variovorax sp. PCZ-1]MBS7808162.1 monofunctional biosynthetic peptidoglycan transglycosylase [Variovorax sp. PCZ-1]